MSEEMKNMNDINDKQTEQDALSEEIRKRLAEPDSGKPTLEEFKVMVYKDREKRRKKRNTIVACVVAAFVVGLFSFEYFVPEVGADKNPKETIVTEDGVIIEDGGWGSSTGEDNVWRTTNWEHVEDAKKGYNELLIPNYIPPKYSFNYLMIEFLDSGDIVYKYKFSNSHEQAIEIEVINVGGEASTEVYELDKTINSNKGKIYIQQNDNNIATIQLNDGIDMYIYSELSTEEIVKIVENFED